MDSRPGRNRSDRLQNGNDISLFDEWTTDRSLTFGFPPRIGTDTIFLSHVRHSASSWNLLLTVRPVLSGIARKISGSALGEIWHLTEGEQDMKKCRVNFVCSEYLAHQRFCGFQPRSSLLRVQRAGSRLDPLLGD